MSRKEFDDSYDYQVDTPYRHNLTQQMTPKRMFSPSVFIQSYKSIFRQRSLIKYQATTAKAPSNNTYVPDFDEQMQFQETNLNCTPKPKSIHHSLKALFYDNNIKGAKNNIKSLFNYLESIQQQINQIETLVERIEKPHSCKQIMRSYRDDHQLVAINHTVTNLISRLQELLNQRNLLQTQVVQEEEAKQTVYTFNKNLNKFLKFYKCKYCSTRFVKACQLGGHISRTHKEEQKLLKQNQVKKSIQKKKKRLQQQ